MRRFVFPALAAALAIAPVAHAQESGTPSATLGSQWSYSDTTDQMNAKSEHFASVNSNNQLDFDFPYAGGSTGTLTIRRGQQYGNDVVVGVDKGQILCDVAEGCSLRVKFDGKPPHQFSAQMPEDGSSNVLFIKPYGQFVSQLKKSKAMLIELQFYQEGRQIFQFNVSDVKWN